MTSSKKRGDVYIGTAGYNYSHWRNKNNGRLYPRGLPPNKELRFYSGVFATVEINNTFHGVPRVETIQGWATTVKPGFRFSVKVPQELTHDKRLRGIDDAWSVFLRRIQDGFGTTDVGTTDDRSRPAPILLFQLPPSLPRDITKLNDLAALVPNGTKIALEFRHRSWYCPEVYHVLRRHGFAICENVSPDGSSIRVPPEDTVTAGTWSYTRFHKRGDRDVTCYADEQLVTEAEKIADRAMKGVTQFVFFLNDHECHGPENARSLARFVGGEIVKRGGLSSLSDSRGTIDLVSDWKADPVIEKGGKGSLQALFAKTSSLKAVVNDNVESGGIPSSEIVQNVGNTMKTKSVGITKGSIKSLFTNSSHQRITTKKAESNKRTFNQIAGNEYSPRKKTKVITSKVSASTGKKSPAVKGSILNFFGKKT
eukprot:CAMPEP_0172483382 /NCGR_PEP_ID=MMETSP1066-20121228/10362_1 /TAXON_ID=671091 /ORGANISM="Coscinodiscus wailesii, Strain CCMP2513" /LENGTH=423 /DNA_ID=CAMNT_0013247221 /DNA_START=241 /DNA_END=1512 /DNA_ORIENTATION=+